MSDTAYFRRRLVYLRRKALLTQEALAEKADLSRNYIGLLESGQRRPSLQTVMQLQKALGVRLQDLMPDPTAPAVLSETSAEYGKDAAGAGDDASREYERLARRLQKCSPEEIDTIARIVGQVLRLRRGGKKEKRSA